MQEGQAADAVANVIVNKSNGTDEVIVRGDATDAAPCLVALLPWKSSPNDAAIRKLIARIRAKR